MKMIVKEFLVYDYEELSKDAQKKAFNRAFEKYRSDYVDYSLADDLGAYACEVVGKVFDGAKDIEVLYDLSGCQGSGAMVEFSIDLLGLNKKYKMLNKNKVKLLEKNYNDILDVKVKHKSDCHYYHEHSFYVDYKDVDMSGYYCCDYLEIAERQLLQHSIDALIAKFREDIVKVNEKIARKGHEYVNNFDFFESCAIDELRDEEFLENGDVYIG